MVADVDAARYLTYQSACLVNMGASDDVRIPMARSFAADAARRVTKEAHQIFAGSGYMLTSRLHYYYRRAKSIGMAYSGSDDLLDRVADHLIGVLDSAAIPAG
jgi:acyl-CoA dehydrogenase